MVVLAHKDVLRTVHIVLIQKLVLNVIKVTPFLLMKMKVKLFVFNVFLAVHIVHRVNHQLVLNVDKDFI